MKFLHPAITRMGMAAALLSGVSVWGQPRKTVEPAPIPSQILAARKVFVSPGGCDVYAEPAAFTRPPDDCYNRFYAGLRSLGRYQLVSAPADADLIMEISFRFAISLSAEESHSLVPYYKPWTFPEFRLVIFDPQTRVTLWTLIGHVEWAIRQPNREKNYDQAIDSLVRQVDKLGTPSAAQPEKP